MTRKHTFEAGEYWITDPCYVIGDKEWLPLLEETGYFGLPEHTSTNFDDGVFEYKGKKCFAHGTAYGDGGYNGSDGFVYWVDAGLISIIPTDVADELPNPLGSRLVIFEKSFEVYEVGGVFYFGNIFIDTN